MNIKKHYVGTCVTLNANSRDASLNPGEFINNLLLFETYTLHSVRLLEFPQLIAIFGFDEVLEVLRSKAIRIKCDANIVMRWGDAKEIIKSGKGFTFEFVRVRASDHKSYINSCLENVRKEAGLQQRQLLSLKGAIKSKLDWEAGQIFALDSPELKILREFIAELPSNISLAKQAVALELRKYRNIELLPSDFDFVIHRSAPDEIKVETNLPSLLRLDELATYEILESALLELAETYERLVLMNRYKALTGMRDEALPVFEGKLEFLAKELNPQIQTNQLKRVLEIKGLPDFTELAQNRLINLTKLLEIRERKECIEFRNWLGGLETATDSEIRDQIESFRLAFGNSLGGNRGKAIKVLVSTAIGFIPLIGGIAGFIGSTIDEFLLDKIFPTSGPAAFINKLIPSMLDIARVNEREPSALAAHKGESSLDIIKGE